MNKLTLILIWPILIIQSIGASDRARLVYNKLSEGIIKRSTTEFLEIDLSNNIPNKNQNSYELLLIQLDSPELIRDNKIDLRISQENKKSDYFDLKKATLHLDQNHILVPLKKGSLYQVDLSVGADTEEIKYKIQLYSPDVLEISRDNQAVTYLDSTISGTVLSFKNLEKKLFLEISVCLG